MPDDAKVSAIWDERYGDGELACTREQISGDPIDYTQHPFLYRHSIARRLTGDLDGNPLQLIADRFLRPPAGKMLAIGVGMAFSEEWLIQCGYVQHVLAFEASTVAADAVRNRFARAGLEDRIEIRSSDVLAADLKDGEFDLVFVQAAIHHFFNIEEMFELMHRVLKPGGLLIYDEYVGPDHHMYGEDVMAIMDEVNDCLAPAYRWDALRNEERLQVPRATMEWMLEMDPSEGVHASRILPLTYRFFDVEYRGDYGGTFMRPFFVGILPNFNFSDEKDQTVARLIMLLEELLIKNAVIPNYHARVVGRRKEIPLPR